MKKLSEIQKSAKAAGLGVVMAKLIPYGKDKDGNETKCLQLLFSIPVPKLDPNEKELATATQIDFVDKAIGCLDHQDVIMAHRVPLYPVDQVRVLIDTDALPIEIEEKKISSARETKSPATT